MSTPGDLIPTVPPTSPLVVLPANHWLFQLANICLLISYVIPNILILRLVLALAGLLFSLWGGIILNISVDTTVWNGVFVMINLVQAGILLYKMRPIKLPPDLNQAYNDLFSPSKYPLSKHDFLLLAKGATVRKVQKGTRICHIGDLCYDLSYLLEGEVEVFKRHPNKKNRLVSLSRYSYVGCFINSPEWASRNQLEDGKPQTYNVSIFAVKECRLLVWQRETLGKTLKRNPTLGPALDAVINLDVTQKLFRVGDAAVHSSEVKHMVRKLGYTTRRSRRLLQTRELVIDNESTIIEEPESSPTPPGESAYGSKAHKKSKAKKSPKNNEKDNGDHVVEMETPVSERAATSAQDDAKSESSSAKTSQSDNS